MSDFNAEISDSTLSDFCKIYSLENIVKDTTCFKNPRKSFRCLYC